MSKYVGIIIEESLADKEMLKHLSVTSTEVELVTPKHETPWIKQWTMHTVEIPEESVDAVAEELSHSLDASGNWYADFKNDQFHYIVYSDKIFKVDLANPVLYKDAKAHGLSLGIPEHQVDFAPDDPTWIR